MGRKIFVSYKFKDDDVQDIQGVKKPTWPCDYVNYLKLNILGNDDIYKGEKQDEDLSNYSEDYIWNHLKDKIYDSTLTIVLISPNMKELYRHQRSQWIPWEISYSLSKNTRSNRTSDRNAILCVILPDSNGWFGYFDKNNTFPILKENINNGYIHITNWNDFKNYPQYHINKAFSCKDSTPEYRIVKSI